MATIESSIKLRDGMTPILKNINKSLNSVTTAYQKLQNISNKGVNTKNINGIGKALGKAQADLFNAQDKIVKMQTKLSDIKNKTIQNANAQKIHNNNLRDGSSSANNLWNKIKGIASAYMLLQGVKGTIGIADELTMTNARLNLMTGDLQKTKEVQDQIYASAMRSRAGYLETADAVAKLRLRAGQIFKTNDEAIAFSETLNKMFAIAGASQSEMYSATLQLTQALGSGVLRGEEFRAVFEAAPNVMQAVADYMNLPIGKLREIANEGAISADIVKNAMFQASKKVDEQFKQIPVTWSQMWRIVKNHTIKATEPILERIRNITKSERFIKFADMVGVAIQKTADFLIVAFDTVSNVVATCFDFIVQHASKIQTLSNMVAEALSTIWKWVVAIADFVVNNWSLIEPIVWGIVGAFVALQVVQAIALITSAFQWMVATYNAIAYQIALFKMTIAQWGFNAALMACPITWIILAVIALIVLFYLAIAAINKLCGTSISATGIIAGCFAWLGATIYNIFVGVWNGILVVVDFFSNVFISIIEFILNACNGGFNSFGDACANLIGQIIDWFLSLGRVVTKIIDAIFGTNWTAGLNALSNKVTAWGKNEKGITIERNIVGKTIGLKRTSATDWYNKGYEWGASLSNAFSSSNKLPDFGQTLIPTDFGYTPISTNFNQSMIPTDANSPATDIGKALKNGFGDTNDALNRIANNTDSINSSLSASDEDLSYMRDLAEREAINRYTMPSYKVEMTNHNQVASELDVGKIMRLLEEQVYKLATSSADGSHY